MPEVAAEENKALDPNNVKDWISIVENSAYTWGWLVENHTVSRARINKHIDEESIFKASTIERIACVMNALIETKPFPFHESFGYATKSEVIRLNNYKEGEAKTSLYKVIAQRTRLKGKIA